MGAPNWMFETDLQDGVVNQSAKFDDASSDYMLLNKSANGNRRTFTLSWWMKMGNIFTGTIYTSGYSGSGGTATSGHIRSSSQKLTIDNQVNNSNTWSITSSRLFRDPTNWYHCVVAVDTTQSTASDRVKLYINGNLETVTGTYPNEDDDVLLNNQYEKIGTWDDGGSAYFDYDGYLADFILVDGTALAPTSFGREVDGVWIPKDTSGLTFGTKGWRLEFKNTGTGTASSSTVGADTSGNDFHFTSYGHPLGNMSDCPDNNFAVLNPLRTNGLTETYSEGNLRYASSQTSTNPATTSTIAVSDGRWYWEVYIAAQGNTSNSVGIMDVEYGLENDNIAGYNSSSGVYSYEADGNERSGGSDTSYGDTWTTGDLIGVALDMVNGEVFFYKNGTIQNGGTALQSSLKTTGSGVYSAYSLVYNNGDQIYNFGQDDTFAGQLSSNGNTGGGGKFRYAPPAGYMALCSRNLDEPAFSANPNRPENANDNFIPYSYTADDTDNKARTGMGFQPDLLWFKDRDTGFSNTLYDSSRGANKYLQTNNANAENTSSDLMSSFDSDGFTTQEDSSSGNLLNYSSDKYIVWSWKANGGTTTTNDASATGIGSIDSTYQVNTNAGFSIVTYTGTGSAGSIAHGLGAVPQFITIKNRSDGSTNWRVYHANTGESDPETDYMYVNLTQALSDGVYLNDTAPTSSVFSIGTHNDVGSSGDDYLAYLWAEVKGYSKFGKYTGTGSASTGPYIHLGFNFYSI